VHVGFAVSQLDEAKAPETLKLMAESRILGQEWDVQSVG
jgi:hydrogenase maturation factor